MENRVERRLAAIMAADIVGYSRLIEADEAGTLATIKELRAEVIDPLIAERHGRIVKLMGDGALVEFGSVVDAVACAVAIQKDVAARQSHLVPEHRIVFRIGINLGDVVVEGDDILGDGVNVAARLEQLCEPGGVLVSGTAFDQMQGRLGLPLDFAGEQQVKNISRPVRAYRVRLDGSQPRRRSDQRRLGRLAPIIAAVLVACALAAGGFWWFSPRAGTASAEPAIAVLPFVNMSGDPAQDYLGPGVAEDIITVLSSFPTIRVVSRTSSFIYDKPVKVQQVAKDLGVNYVLEGSVRKSAGKVHITAQLINAGTGDHIWANRYDEEGEDVVALQEDVANKIYESVAGLRGQIRKQEEQAAWQKDAPSLGEYDYYLRGHKPFFLFTAEGNDEARKIWQEGLTKFPDSALLRIKLAWTYQLDVGWGRSKDPWADIDLAWKLATEAQAKENKSRLETWLSHWQMAILYQWHEADFARSVTEAHAAIDLVPNDPWSRADIGGTLVTAGRTDEAIEWLEKSQREDPKPANWYFGNLGLAYYMAGRPADAIAEFQKMQQPWYTNLAAFYVRAGKLDEARALVAQILKDTPNYTIQDEATWPSGRHPQMVAAMLNPYLDDLRKAGLPDRK